jgi:hypothetical protein
MKLTFTTLATLALCITMSGCLRTFLKDEKKGEKAELETISINGVYSMGVPKYMSKATALNEEASLQFQNLFKETYVIVIDEDKQEFIDALNGVGAYDSTRTIVENYADTQMQLTTSAMTVKERKEITNLTINGLSAATTEVDADVEGVPAPITYFLTFLEGPDRLYMIMAWTLADKKDEHRETFNEMARTFKDFKVVPVASN